MAQALVRHLVAQRISEDGRQQALFGGVFAIFGHGNVSCLGEALYQAREHCLPGAARTNNRWALPRRPMPRRTPPAHLRRDFLGRSRRHQHGDGRRRGSRQSVAGAVPVGRRLSPPPAQSGVPAGRAFRRSHLSVNDAFKPVTRYWDRITHPAQLCSRCLRRSPPCSMLPIAARPCWRCHRTCRESPTIFRWRSSNRACTASADSDPTSPRSMPP